MLSSPTPTRDHALDNLRVAVIVLVVLLHASLSYMAFAPPWWYVLDPRRSLFFTGLVLAIDVPIMLIMFFLAGYFAYPSLARRGAGAFLRDKAVRIGIPWVFGTLVLTPPTAYLIFYSRHLPLSLGDFWAREFWGRSYQQSVYWYLGVLLGFFLLTALLHAGSRPFREWRERAAAPAPWLFPAFLAAMTAATLALTLSGKASFDTWSNNYLFVYQPVRVPLYIGYFALGILANRQRWFTADGYQPRLGRWGLLALAACAVYLAWRLTPHPVPTLGTRAVTAVLFNLFCFAALLGGVALFRAHAAAGSPLWASQARSSYGVYYLHPLVLYPLALLLVPYSLSIYLKAAAITLLAYLACWAMSAQVLTRAPGLRRMF